jgi:ribose 1,5-bisphosphokinase
MERGQTLFERAPEAAAVAPIGGGVFVAVAGPSGVGKDTIINHAREVLAGRSEFVFVRRIITRRPDAETEDHDSLPPEAFEAARRAGKFSLVWRAHGLDYALPRSVDADIAAGRVVVANISRQIIDDLQARYAQFVLVVVSAHRDVIAARLRARGRESDAEIVARLNRIAVEDTVREGAIRLENSGPKERAGDRFVSVLEAAVVDAGATRQSGEA